MEALLQPDPDRSGERTTVHDDPALTTAQAASRLGVAPNSVMNWVDAGLLRAWRTPGGHRRISGASVQAMIERRRSDAVAAQARALSVMVVEDNPDTAAVLSAQVLNLFPGARVRVAGDGFRGLVEAGRDLPDLMLTDVNLPGMDGLAMIRSLRADPSTRRVAFVLLSNYGREELASFGEPPADVPFVSKPVSADALLGAIQLALERRRAGSP